MKIVPEAHELIQKLIKILAKSYTRQDKEWQNLTFQLEFWVKGGKGEVNFAGASFYQKNMDINAKAKPRTRRGK